MNRKRVIYAGILIIIAVIVSITYFSYAFLTKKDEQHGKINVVVGNLDYKIESSLLTNNSITLESYEKARLNIEVTSLNSINSKYELYYITTNNEIEIGYDTSNDLPSGTISSNGTKTVTVIIKNPTNTSAIVTFGVQGGFLNKVITLPSNKKNLYPMQNAYCELASNTVFEFEYTGLEEEFDVPCSGTYKLETWGAQGGYSKEESDETRGGYGAYAVGSIAQEANNKLYINVGGTGKSCTIYGSTTSGTKTCGDDGGYNGGGSTRQYVVNTYYGSGGGATHIATKSGLLNTFTTNSDLLIVSGGGGGASRYQPGGVSYNALGGNAGGIVGSMAVATKIDRSNSCTGGSQTSGGTGSDTSGQGLGHGGNMTNYVGPGGGSGYYGGGTSEVLSCGGSSFIGNDNLTNKKMVCYNCTTSTEANTYTETNTCVSNTATSNCSKSGSGYAKITFLEESIKEEKTKMKYILRFDSNGGSSIAPKIVYYGDIYSNLQTPTKSGKTFSGWTMLFDDKYVPVDYIRSTGTQYIDTGYYWNHENIEIYFDGTVLINSSPQSLFGDEEYYSSALTSNERYFAGIPHGRNGNFSIFIGSKNYGDFSTGLGTRFNLKIKTTSDKQLFVYKDNAEIFNAPYEGTIMTKQNAYLSSNVATDVGNIFIFSNHRTVGGYYYDNPIQKIDSMELYQFKLIDDDTLVRNMIPCYDISTGNVGLYDTVYNKFYQSKSEDNFIKGNIIYINSSTKVIESPNYKLIAMWK